MISDRRSVARTVFFSSKVEMNSVEGSVVSFFCPKTGFSRQACLLRPSYTTLSVRRAVYKFLKSLRFFTAASSSKFTRNAATNIISQGKPFYSASRIHTSFEKLGARLTSLAQSGYCIANTFEGSCPQPPLPYFGDWKFDLRLAELSSFQMLARPNLLHDAYTFEPDSAVAFNASYAAFQAFWFAKELFIASANATLYKSGVFGVFKIFLCKA
jgi:hypothetical protein